MIKEKTVVFQSFFNLFSIESFENLAFAFDIGIVELVKNSSRMLSHSTSISHEVIKRESRTLTTTFGLNATSLAYESPQTATAV